MSTTASSAAARDDSSSSVCGRRHAAQRGQPGDRRGGLPREAAEQAGVAVADARRLAREHEPAARLEHAQHLAERRVEVGDVVQHGVADDDVERGVVVGDLLGVGDPAVDVEAEVLGVAQRGRDHAGREVGDAPPRGEPRLHEVEQEEPGAAAELERAAVGPPGVALISDSVPEAVGGVGDAALVVGDGPLVVVARRLPVVVEDVGELAVVPGGGHLLRRGVGSGRRVRAHGKPG